MCDLHKLTWDGGQSSFKFKLQPEGCKAVHSGEVLTKITLLFSSEKKKKNEPYLVCSITVPNNEFAILRGTDQEPGKDTYININR